MNTEESSERRGREGFAESVEKKYKKKMQKESPKTQRQCFVFSVFFCVFCETFASSAFKCMKDFSLPPR
jgi:hypothetical protein